MNTNGHMSYKNFIFPVNPSVIRIVHSRTVSQQKIPFAQSKVSDLGEKARIISGEGEFFGPGCLDTFTRLQIVFHSQGGGMLYLPSQKPVFALFESLELIGEDVGNIIKYSFRFVESFDKQTDELVTRCIADGNHSLWDYSYLYGIDIETLVRINKDIYRPDMLISHGKKVFLA